MIIFVTGRKKNLNSILTVANVGESVGDFFFCYLCLELLTLENIDLNENGILLF